jgi:ferredoxin
VSLSTAVASRSWVWSLASAAAILIVCVLVPRGFCGYLCPLGTLIDLFDWGIGRRVTRFRVPDEGWWVHIKYYLLLAVMACAVLGVLVSGYVAAIPVITRGMLFLGEPVQSGLLREWRLVPPMNAGHFFSIALFLGVLCLGFLKPRFWCKYVCPSGAVFSLGNLFRVSERKVESSCINCNKCVEICPFDAIKPDFTTRVTDCTLCQTCGGVCPTHAIKFVERWNTVELKIAGVPATGETALGRRGFLSLAAGSAAAIVGGAGLAGATASLSAGAADAGFLPPVRPPGSVPEPQFLQMCIRCGECFKACPNNVLQPMGLVDGLNNLWTPEAIADWAGCEPSCNACGQVCPTGAIRALPLAEKRVARMGLAVVNERTCLPFAGREACQLCVDECADAGYHAIEFTQVHTKVDQDGRPIEGTGFLAPVVLAEKCVGCGICQTRCYGINVDEKKLLAESAIVVEAGEGKEDRLMAGSYLQLREEESRRRAAALQSKLPGAKDYFVPGENGGADDPFGLSNPSNPIAPQPESNEADKSEVESPF